MTLARPEIRLCKPSTKVFNLSEWELVGPGWVLVDCGSGVWGNAVLRCPRIVGAAEGCPEGVACGEESLFGVLEGLCFPRLAEEWLLLIWRGVKDIGRWRSKIVPSFGGRIPLRTVILMTRLQKGRHICAAEHLVVFPIVWKMWAQMSVWAPLMRSHKNYALPRLMSPMLVSRYRLENMINLSL